MRVVRAMPGPWVALAQAFMGHAGPGPRAKKSQPSLAPLLWAVPGTASHFSQWAIPGTARLMSDHGWPDPLPISMHSHDVIFLEDQTIDDFEKPNKPKSGSID